MVSIAVVAVIVIVLPSTDSGGARKVMGSGEGAVIAPPVPAFYARPANLDEMIDQTVGRVLDLFGLESGDVRRWGEPGAEGERPLRSLRHSKGS